MQYAENSPYWETTVSSAKSQGELVEILERFGAEAIMFAQGNTNGKVVWMVRFQWLNRSYRFVFTPLPIQNPNKQFAVSGKRISAEERARFQMGRIAVHFVKAIITAAEMNQDALFGFLELPGANNHSNGMPVTTAEINVNGMVALLPEIIPQHLLTDRGEVRYE
jgi:hypothetical protein